VVSYLTVMNSSRNSRFDFKVGDKVAVGQKIIEGGKERIQNFEGLVIAISGRGEGKTFTVRKIGAGQVAIERIFPLSSPWILKISVKKEGRVRRAKLYYQREYFGKKAQGKFAK